MWQKKRLLIWGKTYPEFSKTYYETVCTGAVDGDSGKLVRIYPITLRYMQEPFKLYDWVEAEVERNSSDFRPESYRIRQQTLRLRDHLKTTTAGWEERARWLVRPGNVFESVEALQAAEERDHTSLGLVKPKSISRFYADTKSLEEKQEWDQQRDAAIQQKDLFVDAESKINDLEFPWAQYRVEFTCENANCHGHDMSILDWGIYVLDRNQQKTKKDYKQAEAAVLAKLHEITDPKKKNAYFFLGNTKAHCRNFMVVGFFYPPQSKQLLLGV